MKMPSLVVGIFTRNSSSSLKCHRWLMVPLVWIRALVEATTSFLCISHLTRRVKRTSILFTLSRHFELLQETAIKETLCVTFLYKKETLWIPHIVMPQIQFVHIILFALLQAQLYVVMGRIIIGSIGRDIIRISFFFQISHWTIPWSTVKQTKGHNRQFGT